MIFSACTGQEKKKPVLIGVPGSSSATEIADEGGTTFPNSPATITLPLIPVPNTLTPEAEATPIATGTIYMIQDLSYYAVSPIPGRSPARPFWPAQKEVPDPSFAHSLAFSNYSDQVAYIPDKTAFSLWVGNVQLSEAALVWDDPDHWLGMNPEDFDRMKITWGPGDHSILLQNKLAVVIVSLLDGRAIRLEGSCDRIVLSPKTDEFALGCPAEENNVKGSLFIEHDGAMWFSADRKLIFNQAVQAWAFSSDFQQVVFADTQNQVMVVHQKGRSMVPLPIRYAEMEMAYNVNGLQWSANGRRILAHVESQERQGCAGQHACWVVLDSQEGKIIWIANQKNIDFYNLSGALSPDGQWLASSMTQNGLLSVGLISLDNGELFAISPRGADQLYWSQ